MRWPGPSARRSLASCAAGACAGVESKFLVDFSGKFGKNCENLGNSMEIWKNEENYVEKSRFCSGFVRYQLFAKLNYSVIVGIFFFFGSGPVRDV